MPIRTFFLLVGALSAVSVICTALVAGASVEASSGGGQMLFEKRCSGCHAMDRDKEGPRLRGVYGRAAGSVSTFQYSEALKNSRITWNAETLDQWLSDPEKLVAGNDMAFHVDKADERRDIIGYLKRLQVQVR